MGLGSPINPWGCHLRLLYGVNRPQVWSCGHCGATSYNLQCWEVCLWGQQIPGCPWTRWVKVQLGELSSVINKCLSLLTHYCSSVSATHFNHHSFWSSQGSSGRCLGKLSLCDSALGSRGCPTTAPLSSISMNARVGGFFFKDKSLSVSMNCGKLPNWVAIIFRVLCFWDSKFSQQFEIVPFFYCLPVKMDLDPS